MNMLADRASAPSHGLTAAQLTPSGPPVQPVDPLPVAKPAKPTTYVVYSSSDDGDTLFVVARDIDAASDVAALKRAVPDPNPDLRYVAIPKRSFRLRGGVAESKPVVKFS